MNARNETLRRMSLHASMEHDVLAESDENPVRRHALWDFCDRAEKAMDATTPNLLIEAEIEERGQKLGF